jgi:hypothetical protein
MRTLLTLTVAVIPAIVLAQPPVPTGPTGNPPGVSPTAQPPGPAGNPNRPTGAPYWMPPTAQPPGPAAWPNTSTGYPQWMGPTGRGYNRAYDYVWWFNGQHWILLPVQP